MMIGLIEMPEEFRFRYFFLSCPEIGDLDLQIAGKLLRIS